MLALNEIIHSKVNINRFTSISAASWVHVPPNIKRNRASIIIKNQDYYSYLWAITLSLHPAEHNSNRLSSYPHFSEVLKDEGIKFSVRVKNIPKFEATNSLGINIFKLKTIGKKKMKYQSH